MPVATVASWGHPHRASRSRHPVVADVSVSFDGSPQMVLASDHD
jgi:hypothetical protein